MAKTTLKLTSALDGLEETAFLYIPDGEPEAIVHVLPGLADHKERYDELCRLLNRLNYVVLIADYRGHGENVSDQIPLGYFADEKGWLAQLQDLNQFAAAVKEQFRHLPYYLLGHSMGALLACSYLKRYEDMVAGVILSALPAWVKQIPSDRRQAAVLCRIKGPKAVSHSLAKAVDRYNDEIKDPQTPFDWLSYDRANVRDFIADPLCGFELTNRGYADLFDGLCDVFQARDWRVLKPELPILALAGEDDVCAKVPYGFRRSLDTLSNAGYRNVKAILYPDMRHDIFHESDRRRVYKDLLIWLGKQVQEGRRQQIEMGRTEDALEQA
jgi:alpha-beta hydrolase superfamily lysophospholipase